MLGKNVHPKGFFCRQNCIQKEKDPSSFSFWKISRIQFFFFAFCWINIKFDPFTQFLITFRILKSGLLSFLIDRSIDFHVSLLDIVFHVYRSLKRSLSSTQISQNNFIHDHYNLNILHRNVQHGDDLPGWLKSEHF